MTRWSVLTTASAISCSLLTLSGNNIAHSTEELHGAPVCAMNTRIRILWPSITGTLQMSVRGSFASFNEGHMHRDTPLSESETEMRSTPWLVTSANEVGNTNEMASSTSNVDDAADTDTPACMRRSRIRAVHQMCVVSLAELLLRHASLEPAFTVHSDIRYHSPGL